MYFSNEFHFTDTYRQKVMYPDLFFYLNSYLNEDCNNWLRKNGKRD